MRFVHGGWVGRTGPGIAAVLALAACTGAPAPIVTELPSASASPSASSAASPSPSATPLTDDEVLALLPEGAERTDLWGAMVTAQFFLEQYAPMFHTGDTRLWQALSADGCGYCADALENAERVRDEGWTATGGEITVDSNSLRGALENSGEAPISFSAVVDASFLVSPTGESEQSGAERKVEFGIVLMHDGAAWRVLEVQSRDV